MGGGGFAAPPRDSRPYIINNVLARLRLDTWNGEGAAYGRLIASFPVLARLRLEILGSWGSG